MTEAEKGARIIAVTKQGLLPTAVLRGSNARTFPLSHVHHLEYSPNTAQQDVPAPSPIPKLFIQMSGAPGSGKSTLARLIRPSINAIIIDRDVLRSGLLESEIIPFDKAAKQAYHFQWELAQDFIKQSLNVIIDSTCNFPEVLEQGSILVSNNGYTYWYVECQVRGIDLLDRRLRNRNPMRSQRSAVDCPPAAAQDARVGEDSRALFHQWIEHPCRPEENAIIVESVNYLKILQDQVLKRILGSLGTH